MKVLLLNGPPRSGKDEIFRIVQSLSDHRLSLREVHHYKMATCLAEAVARLFGFDTVEWATMYSVAKDQPSQRLHGMTPRQALIWLAETVVKPKFGDDFFGVSLAAKINAEIDANVIDLNVDPLIIVSDCGFDYEVAPLLNSIGPHYCHLLRTSREGTTFNDDSRGYIDPDVIGIPPERFTIVNNDGTLTDLENQVAEILDSLGYED